MAKKNAKHSAECVRWFTPTPYADAVRACVGGPIDLDPCSEAAANELIGALRYFTETDNGLAQTWAARTVFLNPPGGLTKQFWEKACEALSKRQVEHVFWIGFSIEQLQTLQNTSAPWSPIRFPICVPDARISFVHHDAAGRRSAGLKDSPSHANFVAYLARHTDATRAAFVEHFSPFGAVSIPR